MISHTAASFEDQCLRALCLAGGVLLVLVSVGWAFPAARWWGVHHLAFLPPVMSAALLLCAALMLSPIGKNIVKRVGSDLQRAGRFTPLAWAGIALCAFVVLHVREPLLGDGQLILQNLATVGQTEARSIPYEDKSSARWIQAGETLLHHTVFGMVAQFHPPLRQDVLLDPISAENRKEDRWFFDAARWTYIVLSSLAGALFTFLVIRFARKMLPPGARAVFLMTMFTASGLLIFFGYVEDYAWTALMVSACLLFAIEESAAPSRWPVKTLLSFAAAIACHLMTVVLAPAVLLLVIFKRVNARSRIARVMRSPWLFVTAAGICAAGYVIAAGTRLRYPIPLFTADAPDGYALFSLRHWADMGNLILLCVAVPVAVLIAEAKKPRNQEARREPPNVPYYAKGGDVAATRVLLMAGVWGAALVVFFNPELGAARDWDLFSVVLWPWVIWAAWSLSQDVRARRDDLLATLAAIALLLPVPYLLENVNQGCAVTRTVAVLGLDPSVAARGWDAIAKLCQRENRSDIAIHCLQRASALDPEPHYKISLADELRSAGKLAEAETLYVAAAQECPPYTQQMLYLCENLFQRGDTTKAISLLERMTKLDPANPAFPKLLKRAKEAGSKAGD